MFRRLFRGMDAILASASNSICDQIVPWCPSSWRPPNESLILLLETCQSPMPASQSRERQQVVRDARAHYAGAGPAVPEGCVRSSRQWREFVLLGDSRIGFGGTSHLIGRFAVVTRWQNPDDLKSRRRCRAGTELDLQKRRAAKMEQHVVAGPVSRHERFSRPPLTHAFFFGASTGIRRNELVQSPSQVCAQGKLGRDRKSPAHWPGLVMRSSTLQAELSVRGLPAFKA